MRALKSQVLETQNNQIQARKLTHEEIYSNQLNAH